LGRSNICRDYRQADDRHAIAACGSAVAFNRADVDCASEFSKDDRRANALRNDGWNQADRNGGVDPLARVVVPIAELASDVLVDPDRK
jgi:hypothetical protein